MSGLQTIQGQTLDILRTVVGPAGTPVALVDYPQYLNPGDALIWQGHERYLRQLGVRVVFRMSQERLPVSRLRNFAPAGPILLGGGGNFGDLYPRHQNQREEVATQYRDRPIVQLAQSMEFRDGGLLLKAQRAFGGHPDLTLLMREERSLEAAHKAFPDNRVLFCPDGAYGVGMLKRLGRPVTEALCLFRTDGERSDDEIRPSDLATAGIAHEICDWQLPPLGGYVWRALDLPTRVAECSGPGVSRRLQSLVEGSFAAMTATNLISARRVLARGRIVITDRLHAMVLAGLSGIPVVALDNNYGKVSGIFRAYGRRVPGTHFAGSRDEALGLAAGLLAR